jgi:hypothetical protein
VVHLLDDGTFGRAEPAEELHAYCLLFPATTAGATGWQRTTTMSAVALASLGASTST